ncbi:MAG: tetratricopeptide repeat protein [Betaproteobacteria bacterium]
MSAAPSRNAPCPCGSGKRYKDCHGALSSFAGPAVSTDVAAPQPPPSQVQDALLEARTAMSSGDMASAERHWRLALASDADDAEANFHIGNLHREHEDAPAAVACYERALGRAPGNASVLNNLGLALELAGERDRALGCYREVLAADGAQADALGNVANALFERNDLAQSAEAYAKLVAIRPALPAAVWVRRALVLQRMGQLAEAEGSLREAARAQPDDPRILANLGSICIEQGKHGDADEPLARVRELEPHNAYALSMLAHARAQRCAWSGIDELFDDIARLLDAPAVDGVAVAPMPLLAMPLAPLLLRKAAERWSRALALSAGATSRAMLPTADGDGRLRVAFVSSDFREHAVAVVISEMLERLDRDRLEVFAYGLLPADTGPAGRRIAAAVEHFADVSALPADAIARRMREDGIAVAFDLNGYTRNARPEVFALRPAPLQINSIGYPGTLGAPWYDYIHIDRFVAPEGSKHLYSERYLRMPHSYYASDTTRAPSGPPPSRAQCGLPEAAFVYCSFNNTFKILPAVFAAWMRILAPTPNAVLWLLDTSAEARANLGKEAQRRGVAPHRLIFAPRVDIASHMARHAAADLFLDTAPYGAHTTCNDALLAGLPVLTCVGESFASRVAGSQLHALGLPELVTRRIDDYEALAVALATTPGRLAKLRSRVAANRHDHALFDMEAYARALEDRVIEAWQRHLAEHRNKSHDSDHA